MPRVLTTPVHVFYPFGKIWGFEKEPQEQDLREFVFDQALWLARGDLQARRRIEAAAAGGASFKDLKELYGSFYRARQLAWSIGHIRSLVCLAVYGNDDSPSLDDFFLTASNWVTIQGFEIAMRDRSAEPDQWVGDWIKDRKQARRKTPTMESLIKHALEPVGNPPCWHSKPHDEILRERPGPKNKLERRAATWGTYWVSWLVGSEKLAVRYWNQMLFPPDFYWGNGTVPEYACKKYNSAKQRLMRDLQTQMNLPSRAERDVNPPRPLDGLTATAVSAFALTYSVQTIRAALGFDEMDFFDRVIAYGSRKKHGWPIREA